MKARKKPEGTKARVQAYKKRSTHIATVITVTILVAIIVISSFFVYSSLNPSPNQTISPNQTSNQPSQPKAAIVDHLSLTWPNQTFIQTATKTLEQAGYTVDYYPSEKVTVEFYRNLPTHRYGLIILRVHSARGDVSLSLFTSESYSTTRYVPEQLMRACITAMGYIPYSEGDPLYFGIGPKFVTHRMNGRFDNSTIIMMGCHGLTYNEMANAFREKGAKVYISWNGMVQASHTDQATTHLLQHLLIEKETIDRAVVKTMKEVGLDIVHKSLLIYYPLEAGDQTIEDTTDNPKTNP